MLLQNMNQLFHRFVITHLLIALWTCVTLCQSSNHQPIAEVPFVFDHTSVIIQVKINGKGPFNMVLDTGSDVSTIDLATAKDLGLNLKPTGQQATGGGSEKPQIFLTQIPQVEIGGLASKNIVAVAVDLSKSSRALGKPLHGVLGYSVLKNRIVQFDYPKRAIRFYSSSPYPGVDPTASSDRRVVLPFRLGDDSPIIDDVYVNGKKIKAVIDTGGGGTYFALMPEAISSLGLEQEMSQAEPDSRGVGVNGLITSRKGKIKTLRVGAINVDSPTVIFYPKGVGKDNRKYGGAIGNAFLQDFVVTFDYLNKTVVLERP
jgi:predicted aspartyl protease